MSGVDPIYPDRFAFEPLRAGGILLDLHSGILFQLNESASFVWSRALQGGSPQEIAAELASKFDVEESVAESDVENALAPPMVHVFPSCASDFNYEVGDDGYRLTSRGLPVLEVTKTVQRIRALSGFNPLYAGVYLRALAPKLVTLLGGSVLHASAVGRPDNLVVAFLGASKAGKTTTAQAFTRAGWRLISEDKLVVRYENDRLEAVLPGEGRILSWIDSIREQLTSSNRGRWFHVAGLEEATTGETLPLGEIVFVDAARRGGTDVALRAVNQVDGAGQVFQNAFYGSSATADWKRQLRAAATIARTTKVFLATMPPGVDRLMNAARRYTEITAS